MIKRILITAAFAISLSFATMAQNNDVALEGHCPVAYYKMNKPVKGKEKFSSTYKGETYYFVKGKAKKIFDKNPGKFVPAYNGYCAAAMAKGKKLESDPSIFVIHEGTLYMFSNKKAKKMFNKNPDKFIKKANKNFKDS